jgi:hypothetical protein
MAFPMPVPPPVTSATWRQHYEPILFFARGVADK